MQGPLQHALVLQNLEEFMRQSWVDLIHPELLHHFEEQLWIFSEKLAWHSSRSTLLAYVCSHWHQAVQTRKHSQRLK